MTDTYRVTPQPELRSEAAVLASECVAVEARIKSLEQDVITYRAMVLLLLAVLADLQEPRRLREENARLREELMRADAERAA